MDPKTYGARDNAAEHTASDRIHVPFCHWQCAKFIVEPGELIGSAVAVEFRYFSRKVERGPKNEAARVFKVVYRLTSAGFE